LDYPQEGERIVSAEYAFRIGAQATRAVEISIDDGAWRPCRQAEGYWWFDWSGYGSGGHHAVARIQRENGRKTLLATRRFLVERT
jgi:hypothetical protein